MVDGIPQVSVETLKKKLDANEDVFVLDVREPHEYQIANLGAPLIPVGFDRVALQPSWLTARTTRSSSTAAPEHAAEEPRSL